MSTANHRSDGRFAPNNRAGLGNPNNRKMQQLRKALLDSAEPDDVRRVGKRLLVLAEGGDVSAAKVYLEYLIGKPPQALELSGPDGEPLLSEERLTAVIMSALSGFPEARVQVAVALRKALADDGGDDEPAGPDARPGAPDGGPGFDPGPLAGDGGPLDGE